MLFILGIRGIDNQSQVVVAHPLGTHIIELISHFKLTLTTTFKKLYAWVHGVATLADIFD